MINTFNFEKVSRLTKVEFNCLKLVLSIDSWVAVLDFFGVAGDEAEEETGAGDNNGKGDCFSSILSCHFFNQYQSIVSLIHTRLQC